jgi:hypothetical protein
MGVLRLTAGGSPVLTPTLFSLLLALPFVSLVALGLWLRPAGLRSFGGRA